MPSHRLASMLLLEEEEEEENYLLFMSALYGQKDVDIEAAMLLLGQPISQNLLNEKNYYRYFEKEKEWEDLQQEYPSPEEWKGAFRFKLE